MVKGIQDKMNKPQKLKKKPKKNQVLSVYQMMKQEEEHAKGELNSMEEM